MSASPTMRPPGPAVTQVTVTTLAHSFAGSCFSPFQAKTVLIQNVYLKSSKLPASLGPRSVLSRRQGGPPHLGPRASLQGALDTGVSPKPIVWELPLLPALARSLPYMRG